MDGEASSLVKVTSGVPQGTVLGPLMFLLFINDIHENLDSTLRLFADDALLYRSISTVNDSVILQNDIDKLVSWSKTWQMQFNVSKCYTMRISRRKEPVLMDYYIDGYKLSPVKNHPYLGVMLSDDLRWNSHVDNIVVKANKSLGFVRRNLYPCSENTKRSAYVTIVRPNLEYATAVWDPYRQEQIDSIEAVQRRAARFIKRDYDRTSSVTEMLRSLNLDPLEERRKAHRLNIFYLAVNNLIALPIPNYFLPKQRFTRLFSNNSFIQASCNHDYYFYSFFPRTIRDWNSLPSSIHASTKYSLFKDHCFSAIKCN